MANSTSGRRPRGLLSFACLLATAMLAGACGGHGSALHPSRDDTSGGVLPAVNLDGWAMPAMTEIDAPAPANATTILERLSPYLEPADPAARETSGAIKSIADGSVSVHHAYPTAGYFDYEVSTPFNAQSPTQFTVDGNLSFSGLRNGRYVQVGLVTNAVYNYAMDPDGVPATNDANPALLFNQSALMLFTDDASGNPFVAPFDFNGSQGMGTAQPAPAGNFSFSLRFKPNPLPPGGKVALKINNGAYGPDFNYVKNNWGWWPAEDYSQARLVVMAYSYNASPTPFMVNFTGLKADDPAYNPSAPDWQHTWGMPGADSTNAVAVDASGNVYLGGSVTGGAGGGVDALLEQWSPAGILNWAKTWGGPGTDAITGLAIDSAGNIHCSGYTSSFGAANGENLLYLRYSSAGAVLLQRVRGIANTNERGTSISLDPTGVAYMGASFGTHTGIARFLANGNFSLWRQWASPGIDLTRDVHVAGNGLIYLTGATTLPGTNDLLLLKYDSTGALQAQSTWGGAGSEAGSHIAEASGKLYISGAWQGDGGPGGSDPILLKYDLTGGTLDWQRAWGSVGNEFASGVVVDPLGRIFVTGMTDGFSAVWEDLVLSFSASGSVTGAQRGGNGLAHPLPTTVSASNAALAPDGSIVSGDAVANVTGWNWTNVTGSTVTPAFALTTVAGTATTPGGTNTTPTGVEASPTGTLDTGGGGDDALIYKHPIPTGANAPSVMVDCTSLANASFTLWNPVGPTPYTGTLSTNTVFDASATLFSGDQFYVTFGVDAGLSPNDLLVYPSRLGTGVVTVTPSGLQLDPSLSNWFTVPFGTKTLTLKPNAYNRIANNMKAGLPDAQYILQDQSTVTTIGGPFQTNTSDSDRVVLAASVLYRPVFSALPYPQAGSTGPAGANETIYHVDWAPFFFDVGFGALTEGGAPFSATSMDKYFTQAGLTNTMDSDAFVRMELTSTASIAPYSIRLQAPAPAGAIIASGLNNAANPRDILTVQRGVTFRGYDNASNQTGNFGVLAGHLLTGNVTTLSRNFAAAANGSLTAQVISARVADDITQPDPSAPAMIAGLSPWTATLKFLLQYGVGPYTVELDGDYGSAWNDGTPGRTYAVNGSPFASNGFHSATSVLTNHSPGLYTFAIRVTDGTGAQHIYVWPNQVNLPASGWTPSHPNADDASANRGRFNSMAIVGGNPAMAYFDFTNDDLVYVRAVDVNGANWGAPVLVDGSGGVDRGWDASLCMVGANPAIAYTGESGAIGGGNIYYVRATNATGTAWGAPVTVIAGNHQVPSMAMVNGRPSIAFYAAGSNQLGWVRANNATGTTWPVAVGLANNAGNWPSLVVVNGNPAVAYYAGDPLYRRATDANGTAWAAAVDIGPSPQDSGYHNSMAIINGNPAVAYYENDNGDLRYVRATDTNGAAWGSFVTVDSTGTVGQFPSLAFILGSPSISYWDVLNDDLKYARSSDTVGAGWFTPTAIDTDQCGDYSRLLDVNGQPGISYNTVANGGDLRFIRLY